MSTEIIHQILVKNSTKPVSFFWPLTFCANRQMRSYVGITVHFISN